MSQLMSKFRPKGCCHFVNIVRPVPTKTKGVKHYDCDTILLYENVPARVGESRSIEENRLQDVNPYGRSGDMKSSELTIMLCPSFPLNNFKAGDWILIPWNTRPNTASPVEGLPGIGPNIWIETPTGQELLTWSCDEAGNGSFQGAVTIYQNEDGWCMQYEGQEHCFSNNNFICSEFPEGYSFTQSTGPSAAFSVLKIDQKQDHACRLSHYNVFAEFVDQECVVIQQ